MATKMHFGDFNPLEVLATAASLQSVATSAEGSGGNSDSGGTHAAGDSALGNDNSESDEPNKGSAKTSPKNISNCEKPADSGLKTQPTSVYRIHIKSLASAGGEASGSSSMGRNTSGSCIVKVVTRNNNTQMKSANAVSAKACETRDMPTVQDTKRVTVLGGEKQTVDHSYASIGHLDRSKTEEDEGYVSRSSIDSPGQAWRSDSEVLDLDVTDSRESGFRDVKSPVTAGLPVLTLKSPISTRPPSVDIASPLSVDSEASDGLKSPSILARHSPAALSPGGSILVTQQASPGAIPSSPTSKKAATKIVIVSRDTLDGKLATPKEQQVVLEANFHEDKVAQTGATDQPENVLRSLLGSVPATGESSTLPALEQTPDSDGGHSLEMDDPNTPSNMDKMCLSATSEEKSEKTEPSFTSNHIETQDIDTTVCSASDSEQLGSSCEKQDEGDIIKARDSSASADTEVDELPSGSVDLPVTAVNGPQSVVVSVPDNSGIVSSSGAVMLAAPRTTALQTVKPPAKRSVRKSGIPTHLPPVLTNPAIKDKMILLPLTTRNQYIIEDDVPPLAKVNSNRNMKKSPVQTLVPMSRIAGVLVADRSIACTGENQDAWEVLGTVNSQGVLTHPSSGAHVKETVSIPVAVPAAVDGVSQGLCSKLMAPPASGAVLLPCNNVSEPAVKSVLNQQPTGSLMQKTSPQLNSTVNTSVVPLKVTAVGLAAQGKSVVIPSPPPSVITSVSPSTTSAMNTKCSAIATNITESSDAGQGQLITSGVSDSFCDSRIPVVCKTNSKINTTVKSKPCVKEHIVTPETEGKNHILDHDNAVKNLLHIMPQQCSSDPRGSPLLEPQVTQTSADDQDLSVSQEDSSDAESSHSENSETASALSVDDDYSRSGLDSGRVTPVALLESSSGEKINIKISGSKVIDVTGGGESSSAVRKSSTSIGTVGSLSWTSLGSLGSTHDEEDTSARGSSPLSWNLSPAAVSPAMRNLLVSSDQLFPGHSVKQRGIKNTGAPRDEAASARTCHTYVRRRGRVPSMPSMTSMADLSRAKQSALLISRLHPLIDHDYCTFAEFSADIQSSIIATTETKIRNERKYAKKAKAARTKAVRSLPPVEKTGRVKRKYVRRKLLNAKKVDTESTNVIREKLVKTEKQTRAEAIKEGKRRAMAERKAKMKAHMIRDKSDKNYVKITGSYQDEFVYFATKKTRGRPRKATENVDVDNSLSKNQSAGGLIDFDYYKDLSKADKNSRFGISGPSENATDKVSSGEVSVLPNTSLANESFDNLNLKMTPTYNGPGSTPLQDSDVVDLVMDLMPTEQLDVTTSCADNHRMLNGFMSSDQVQKTEEHSTSAAAAAESPVTTEENIEPEDLARMAEQVRSMINSMDPETSLKMLEKLGDSIKETQSAVDLPESAEIKEETVLNNSNTVQSTLNGLNSLLSSCSSEPVQTQSLSVQQPSGTQLLDLDDINDSDLIRSDMASMNMILGDLTTSTKSSSTWVDCKSTLASLGDGSASPLKNYMDSDTETPKETFTSGTSASENSSMGYSYGRPLDQSELFPDLSGPGENSAPANDCLVPELTVVSMYWNDLPGLLINGQQCVRLVDIHKQILPAKDTGILKKRAQMMGLDIANCSELQRDFLIRYANAAKSKSTVIVSKGAAQTLIGFYVDPRPRVAKPRSVDNKEDEEDIEETGAVAPSIIRCAASTKSNNHTDRTVKDEKEKIATSNESDSIDSCAVERTAVNRDVDQQPHVDGDASSDEQKRVKKRLPASTSSAPAVVPENHNADSPSRPGFCRRKLDVKRSARLRNKKVQYAVMLQGNYNDVIMDDTTVSNKVTKGVAKLAARDSETNKVSPELPQQKHSTPGLDNSARADFLRQSHPEEQEIRKLRGKQKKRPLSTKDRKRLKQLRERMRKRMLKSKTQEEKLKKIAKVKLKEKPPNSDKYQQEHCYAAYPKAKSPVTKPQMSQMKQEQHVTVSENSDIQVKEDSVEESEAVEVMCEVTLDDNGSGRQQSEAAPQLVTCKMDEQVLEVVHRGSQRGRGQEGLLHLKRLMSREALAICCSTCHQFLSIRKFLKHLHHHSSREELVEVPLPHKLEPLSSSPSLHQQELWVQFEKIRSDFNKPRNSSRVQNAPQRDATEKKEAFKIEGINEESSVQVLDGPMSPSPASRCSAKDKSVSAPTISPSSSDSSFVDTLADEPQDNTKMEYNDDTGAQSSGTRHSTRVRKRKQLHPMESYIFSGSAACVRVDSKRARHEPEFVLSDAKRRN